jgi:hypothetical protein
VREAGPWSATAEPAPSLCCCCHFRRRFPFRECCAHLMQLLLFAAAGCRKWPWAREGGWRGACSAKILLLRRRRVSWTASPWACTTGVARSPRRENSSRRRPRTASEAESGDSSFCSSRGYSLSNEKKGRCSNRSKVERGVAVWIGASRICSGDGKLPHHSTDLSRYD